MKSNTLSKYGALLCGALTLLAGSSCRTRKQVTANEAQSLARVETTVEAARADTARAEFAAVLRDSARVTAEARDSVFFVFGYDEEGRVNSIRGSRFMTETTTGATAHTVQMATGVAAVSHSGVVAATDTVKREGEMKTATETEAGANVLSTLDRAMSIMIAVVGLALCAWLAYRLRKITEKWAQRGQ